MQTFGPGPASPRSDSPDDRSEQPFLEVAGAEGSILRATPAGLTVCPGRGPSQAVGERSWAYDQIRDVHLDADGPIGVIRATIRSSGTELPLLLLEPDQIPAARRTLEIVRNLMGAARLEGRPA